MALFKEYVECNIVTDVLKQKKDISTNNPRSTSRLFTNFKKMCFICNDKCIEDNNTFNVGVIGRSEMDCAKRRFFFTIGVFFHDHSRITGLQGKGEGISITPHFHTSTRFTDT